MADMSDLTKSVMNEEERKRLISEISKIKEVLDSFKYGLNFEEFADELFKTINRQVVSTKNLESKMDDIIQRLERLELAIDEGIKVRVSGFKESETSESGDVIIERPEVPIKEETTDSGSEDISKEELESEADDLTKKIAMLFEKENELIEMGLNDPAGAEEYEEKASVARQMRGEHKARLKEIKELLK